jgi:ABC-type antimicrobial peptide transport system permease subunit
MRIAWIDDVLRRVEQQQPGVLAGMLTLLPSSGAFRGTTVELGGVQAPAAIRGMTPGVFGVLGLRILQGSVPTVNEAGSERYAVVDEILARKLDPSGGVVGRIVRWVPGNMEFVVAGVSAAAKFDGPHSGVGGTIFLPLGPYGQRSMHLLAWGLPANQLQDAVHAAVASTGVAVPVSSAIEVGALVKSQYQRHRVGSTVIGLYWLVLAAVSAVGFAGVAAVWISEHERESAIRRALGATTEDIRRWALRSWVSPVSVGVVVGITLSSVLLQGFEPKALWLSSAGFSALACTFLIGSVFVHVFWNVTRQGRVSVLLRA